MSSNNFVILAYVIGIGLLWGQAVAVCFAARNVARREQTERGKS